MKAGEKEKERERERDWKAMRKRCDLSWSMKPNLSRGHIWQN